MADINIYSAIIGEIDTLPTEYPCERCDMCDSSLISVGLDVNSTWVIDGPYNTRAAHFRIVLPLK